MGNCAFDWYAMIWNRHVMVQFVNFELNFNLVLIVDIAFLFRYLALMMFLPLNFNRTVLFENFLLRNVVSNNLIVTSGMNFSPGWDKENHSKGFWTGKWFQNKENFCWRDSNHSYWRFVVLFLSIGCILMPCLLLHSWWIVSSPSTFLFEHQMSSKVSFHNLEKWWSMRSYVIMSLSALEVLDLLYLTTKKLLIMFLQMEIGLIWLVHRWVIGNVHLRCSVYMDMLCIEEYLKVFLQSILRIVRILLYICIIVSVNLLFHHPYFISSGLNAEVFSLYLNPGLTKGLRSKSLG